MRHPYFDVATPTVIGHRGCAGEAPENTLPSFALGLRAGAAILESDVHLTRDGAAVLLHDDVVDRTTDGAGRVAELSLAQLHALDAGHRFSADGGRTHPFRGQGLRVPTLEAALASFPDARFNLELKEGVPGLVERCLEVVQKSGSAPRTLLTAGDDALMGELRAQVARRGVAVALGASAREVGDFLRSAIERRPPPPGPMALQVPPDFAGRPLVTREFVAHAHAHELVVHVWTIDEPDEMRALLALGVDGIVTDFPARLAAVIGQAAEGGAQRAEGERRRAPAKAG
ncbi:MAG TPA: glycerophosphodiester phosphodiesterase [Myxococcota bacterium]|jgi:glycerophosphoryl diester phosphodiesterase